MKLFVIGATGRTGGEVVQQALARGHMVTAFVRSPEGIHLKNEGLKIVKSEVTDEEELFRAMQNHDAVVSLLGPRKVFKPGSILHDSAVVITRAMHRAGIKRLVVLSAAAHFPGIPNRIASFIMRDHSAIRWQWKKSSKTKASRKSEHQATRRASVMKRLIHGAR